MRIYKIFLISLLLLILASGAVSASSLSDNVTSDENTDIIADDDDFVEYDEGSGSITPDVKVNWPSEIRVGEFVPVTFSLPEDMDSKVCLFINNERVDDGDDARNNVPYEVFIDDFGTCNLKFRFYGDDKYAPVDKSKTYNVNDYFFKVEVQNDTVIYGQTAVATIEFPFDAQGNVNVNGEVYNIEELYSYIKAPLKNLNIGTNQIQIKYSGDDKYPSKTVKINVNVGAEISYSESMPFNNATFSLMLPDAEGYLEVSVDKTSTKTSRFTNNLAEVTFTDLTLAGHSVVARYVGNDYSVKEVDGHFEATPQIIIDSFKTTSDENNIEIRLPKGVTGTAEVKIHRYLNDDVGLEVSEVTKSANVADGSVIELSTLYYGYYVFEIRFTSADGYFHYMTDEGYIRDEFSMNMSAPQSVLADDDYIQINVTYLDIDSGYIALYVDGDFYDELDCEGTDTLTFCIEDCLSVGNHVITTRFLGNDRYAPMEKSQNITSDYVRFNIPDEIIIGSDEIISVDAIPQVSGNLAVYVDGVEFAKKAIKDGYASVNMSSLPFKTYSVRVVYSGNYPSLSKSVSLTVVYEFKAGGETFTYASPDLYYINVPSGLSLDKLVVKVDNEVYPFSKADSKIGINMSGLYIGPHIISVTHPGDANFYPLSMEKTVNVAGVISVPSKINLGDDECISLILPQDPEGSLVLSEYDENYNYYADITGFPFVYYGDNSIAEIPLSFLSIGTHQIKVRYSGSDFNVTEVFTELSVDLDLKYNRHVQYSKKSTITIRMPDADGSIDVFVDSEYSDVVEFINDVATITFSDLEVGQHSFELYYDGYNSFSYGGTFTVYPIISVPSTVIDGSKSITVNSGFEPVGSVLIYADGKLYKEIDLDEDEQSISLSGLSNGQHKLSVVYDTWDEMTYVKNYTVTTKKASITAKDMSMDYLDGSKFKVQVKDYNGKAVGKNQLVKFYVDGKLFKTVKTDSNGYAYVVLTHAPKTHSVKAVYKATSLTKKVTVKQIITLKKVTVKKSAKKLTLTATLKKIKGKYLKNKQITFKFNGKTYKAKTNSKGVAKITVPSNVLKKLKVGKSVTYQATYVKASVKQSVKVKK